MTTERWNFDLTHSSINFSVRHMMVSKVRGRFAAWEGTFEFDEQTPSASRVTVAIDAASVDTREPKRDDHLRSADFLEAATHPHIRFASTSVERGPDGKLLVRGDLSIRGTTRPITLDVDFAGRVTDPWGGERVGFSARTSIQRQDFGLTWNTLLEAGGIVVGDRVDIDIEIEAVRQVAVTTPVSKTTQPEQRA